jgi:hypothetical protein
VHRREDYGGFVVEGGNCLGCCSSQFVVGYRCLVRSPSC